MAGCFGAPDTPRRPWTWRGWRGCSPAGVICEILRDDGRMARLPELRVFARKHRLKIASIESLIAWRRGREKLVQFIRAVELPTAHGLFKLHLYASESTGRTTWPW